MEHGWLPGVSVENLATHESLDQVCGGLHHAWTLFGNDKYVLVSFHDLIRPEL